MILCWYLEADGKPSVGAGSWMFLGIPETGATGNFVSAEVRQPGALASDKNHPGSMPEALPYPYPLGFCLFKEAGELWS